MPTRKNAGGGETPDVIHQKGWLNLSLRPYLGDSRSNSRSTTSTNKVYTCSFCKRKFYSSQALGGHQNAHRRERDAVRRYNLPKTMNFSINQSLHAHSLGTDGETSVALFTDSWGQQPFGGEEPLDNLKWPGSFHPNSQPASSFDPHTLDLNLKL